MKRLVLATAAALVLAAPAYAQFGMGGGGGERDRTRYTEEQRRTEAEVEKAYKETVKNTRGHVSETYDPWRNIRPSQPETKKQPNR